MLFRSDQKYQGHDDYKKHFMHLLPAFKDKRYIRIENKPLFLVYKPFDIPDAKEFLEIWNRLAIDNGLEGIHFVDFSDNVKYEYNKLKDIEYNSINSCGCHNI